MYDALMEIEGFKEFVQWVRVHWIISIVAFFVIMKVIHKIGDYCGNCGSRDKKVDTDKTVAASLLATILTGGLSAHEVNCCGSCGEEWVVPGIWRLIVLLYFASGVYLGYLAITL